MQTMKQAEKFCPYEKLEGAMLSSLENYSNVYRGSGYKSMVTTKLFERAREIVLEYLGLTNTGYLVIFCTPRRALRLTKLLEPGSCKVLSSKEFGLTLGVRAVVVMKNKLPKGNPLEPGGGTTKLYSQNWVIWANAPEKFEAGTPAIINIIAFAKALLLIREYGSESFKEDSFTQNTVGDILYQDEFNGLTGKALLDKLRESLIGQNVQVPTIFGESQYIHFDNSASTPAFAPAWDAFRKTYRQSTEIQQKVIEEVRNICAGFLNAPTEDYDVIFSSNTTEAINIVAESLGMEPSGEVEPVILSTILEHSSNDLPWRQIAGHQLIRLPVDTEGFFDMKTLDRMLKDYNKEKLHGNKRIKIVTVSGASNVLGTCNNISEISRIAHQYGARLLVDAAQLIAHRKIDVGLNDIDFLVFSAHKVYAPFGSGALVVKKDLLQFNTGQMEIVRSSGEENAAGIAALGKALMLLQKAGFNAIEDEEQLLTRKAILGLAKIPGLKIYGISNLEHLQFSERTGVISFEIKNKIPGLVSNNLAFYAGIGVRFGCHCAHLLIKNILNFTPMQEKIQRFVLQMLPTLKLQGVIRVSFGIGNTEKDVDTLISVLKKMADKKASKKLKVTKPEPALSKKSKVKKNIAELIENQSQRIFG
jgi:selenocysteine lyase/cysteine desulfurase